MNYIPLYRSFFLTEDTILTKFNEWIEKVRLQESFLKNLTLMYEYEYKYNKISSLPMMNDKRKDNILSLIEDKMQPIVKYVLDDLIRVYSNWSINHAMFLTPSDTDTWLRTSYIDVIHNTEDFRNLLIAEYVSYARKFTKAFKQDVYEYLETIDDKKELMQFALKYIYPMWLEVWKRSDMQETIRRIGKHRDELDRIRKSNTSFKEKQVVINMAVNMMHQTGSMKEHIARDLECSEKDLDKLSNLSMSVIKKWDKDLVEMGVY